MSKVLIAGASQGLGLSFVKRYLSGNAVVFAGMRNTDNEDIKKLQIEYPDTLIPFTIDVSRTDSVETAFDFVKTKTEDLDIVICNAGITTTDLRYPLEGVDIDSIHRVFDTNTLGSLRIAKRAVPMLRKGNDRMFVNISSAGASFKHIIYLDTWQDEYPYAYCMSKAALNMGAAILQRYVKTDGIKVLCLHPGLLKSRMWNPEVQPYDNERMTTDESAVYLEKVIEENKHKTDGPLFLNYDGEVFPF